MMFCLVESSQLKNFVISVKVVSEGVSMQTDCPLFMLYNRISILSGAIILINITFASKNQLIKMAAPILPFSNNQTIYILSYKQLCGTFLNCPERFDRAGSSWVQQSYQSFFIDDGNNKYLRMQGQQQVKVIVLGDSGVGKSCLLIRFVNNEFNEFSEPTLGAAFLSKLHEYGPGKSVRFQVWDTAGQEKYKSIASIYYRDAQVAVCVYDITNKHSFQVLKNWVDQLKSKGPSNIILAVVGNKIDRADDEQVPYNEAKEYSQSIGAIFKLTSAKEGKGVGQLFTSIAERLEELKNQNAVNNRQTTQLTSKNNSGKDKKGCCGKN